LTCKNRLPYNLYCVGGDVKHCTIQSIHSHILQHLQCVNTCAFGAQFLCSCPVHRPGSFIIAHRTMSSDNLLVENTDPHWVGSPGHKCPGQVRSGHVGQRFQPSSISDVYLSEHAVKSLRVHCVSKNAPTLKRYSSKLQGSISMIFGRNIQKAL